MKPLEILSLIEEAATRTLKNGKIKLKTMAKKEAKLTEIRNLLSEEIEPKLENFVMKNGIFLNFNKRKLI